ncbi:hypothetical protein BJ085DRAFT_28725 [Dimargaris cristalligena]|uniref:Uncharacterized protein n=1 Tax=Dimargaris cristalligena TaxID=215637 RepID=A0A4P9ZRI9_9FUNG|nr:hypothetical protein BJ085DRAFT_28725 [Dimargaris cristalligena]|eukprot:RKP36134.1 hypothetical protein BJ085DRAFT_28725 [Dimargaris cristalligena]
MPTHSTSKVVEARELAACVLAVGWAVEVYVAVWWGKGRGKESVRVAAGGARVYPLNGVTLVVERHAEYPALLVVKGKVHFLTALVIMVLCFERQGLVWLMYG